MQDCSNRSLTLSYCRWVVPYGNDIDASNLISPFTGYSTWCHTRLLSNDLLYNRVFTLMHDILAILTSVGDIPSNSQRLLQYIPRNMHTVFALLCFVVVIHWLIFPYQSGLLHWHCGNLTIAPVPAKQPWWIWINTSCEFITNDCITTTKQSTAKPYAYFLGYTVFSNIKC